VEPDWTYLDFLNAASNRLKMGPAAKRCFNSDGVEINDCMMIEDDDMLFLSPGEGFVPPFDQSAEAVDNNGNNVEGEKLAHTIGGYKTTDLLGRGAFGEVRVGEHHITGEKVALKFLRKSDIHSLGAADRTKTEIQCLMALKHTNIIRLQQQLESHHHVVLVFELMEGGDLLKYLIRRQQAMHTPRACLTENEARHVFYQVLSAVSHAHNQHICHRDLKLENILLKDSTLSLVKIADFGLSDFYRPGTVMKSSCGTLSFLAPEVFKGTANAGPPLDVWAMGVILFALLSGRLPFEGPDLIGTKRPRDAVIKSRIMKCQFVIDENLGAEAKDLFRLLLQGDPVERISISEIFNHSWLRSTASNPFVDQYHQFVQAQNAPSAGSNAPASTSALEGLQTPSTKSRKMPSGSNTPAIPSSKVSSNNNPSNLTGSNNNSHSMFPPVSEAIALNSNTSHQPLPLHNASNHSSHPHPLRLGLQSGIVALEELVFCDPLKGHLTTPPSMSPSAGSSKQDFHFPSPHSAATTPVNTHHQYISDSPSPSEQLSSSSRGSSRRLSRTKEALQYGAAALTGSDSPYEYLSPRNSGDRNSLNSADGQSHESFGGNLSSSKSTIKLIPLRRNSNNAANHQSNRNDSLNSNENNPLDHGELPSFAHRSSGSSQHSGGLGALIGNTGDRAHQYYNCGGSGGDDSSVVSTVSAPSSQPPRSTNRPSTVTAGNRGRNIINSIVKEDDPTIVHPPISSTLESPYGSRKLAGRKDVHRNTSGSSVSSNSSVDGNGYGSSTGGFVSHYLASKGHHHDASSSKGLSKQVRSTTASSSFSSSTLPPPLASIGAQHCQTSMSSSCLTPSSPRNHSVSAQGPMRQAQEVPAPGVVMNTDGHHPPVGSTQGNGPGGEGGGARNANHKQFNTIAVGAATATGKTRFL
jgi:serine/threonine protein kinase